MYSLLPLFQRIYKRSWWISAQNENLQTSDITQHEYIIQIEQIMRPKQIRLQKCTIEN